MEKVDPEHRLIPVLLTLQQQQWGLGEGGGWQVDGNQPAVHDLLGEALSGSTTTGTLCGKLRVVFLHP